jgi:glycosyltransferase involved in cell wall biosynthesis
MPSGPHSLMPYRMSNDRRIIYIFHGRFPSEKAAALFTAESAASFAAHAPAVIVVPRRLGALKEEAHAYYGLPASVALVRLPTIDIFGWPVLGRFAFMLSTAVFSLMCGLYFAVAARKEDVVISNEPFPLFVATFFARTTVFEVHDFPERHHAFYRSLFRRASFVLATNLWKGKELSSRFGVAPEKLIVERNGVDIERFGSLERTAARRALSLPQEARLVVYTGHLYSWKGADVLARAARHVPEAQFYFVGGTKADVALYTGEFGSDPNVRFLGHRPHEEMPLWQAAADVLALPNTAKEEISARYTSPMKLFEYLASGRPIVATDLASIREVLPEEAGLYVAPDDPEAMAAGIRRALSEDGVKRGAAGRLAAQEHSWEKRASRIMERIYGKR